MGHQPDQGQLSRTRPRRTCAHPPRPTPNTSRSTGKPAAVAPLPSSPSMSAAGRPTSSLSSAATLPPSSTPTGMVAHGMTGPSTTLTARRSPFNDSLISSASDDGKVGIWKVPENFTLHTDAEEPADVAPVAKLSGHMRYADALGRDSHLTLPQEGRPCPLQHRRRERPRQRVWRLHRKALGRRGRSATAHAQAQRHCPIALMERRRIAPRHHEPRQEAARMGCTPGEARPGGSRSSWCQEQPRCVDG